MRLLIIAGEASGDTHGASVVKALKNLNKDLEISGIGGDKMKKEGVKLIYHIDELAIMGSWEVIKKLPIIRSVSKTLDTILQHQKPDAVLLIDYPGFNLRFAEKAHNSGIKTFYYIAPQIWAWNFKRIEKIKKCVDKVFVVFEFEEEIYKKAGINVEYVGHPILDIIEQPMNRSDFCKRYGFEKNKPIIGLFPGSRYQEVDKIFPTMLNATKDLETEFSAQIAVGAASVFEGDYIKSFLDEESSVKVLQYATYDLMKNCDVAIVTSGTATLELAYFNTPMVILYKTSFLTYLIGRLLIKIKNIGLANILAGKQIVPELIQHRACTKNIVFECAKFLKDENLRNMVASELKMVAKKLGKPGASIRVAESILKFLL